MDSSAGGISGVVADALTTQPIPFATVTVSVNGVRKGGATTDMDGKFLIKPLPPDTYNLEANFTGYQTAVLKKIGVAANKTVTVDVPMSPNRSSQ